MQTKKITRNWAIATAVAAMLAASGAGVRVLADDTMTTTPPSSTSTTSSTDTMTTTSTTGSLGDDTATGTIDYHILNNPNYDYINIKQAQARGLSDSQIATIAKIAKETGKPFHYVAAAVERGETFPMLASEWNLKLGDVYDIDKQKAEIANYMAAYAAEKALGSSTAADTEPMSTPVTTTTTTSTTSTMTTEPATPVKTNTATLDIVDTAMAAKNLTTLVKALQTAGLVETLKSAGPFTVFAPTNKAFSKLPAGTLDALLADPAKLKTILTYHVIPASIDAATALSMTSPTSPPTVEGATLQVTKGKHNKLMINDATVVKANILASNGVIHIIDKVLMPPVDTTTDTTGTMTPAAPATPPTDTTGTMAPAAPATPGQ